MEKYPSGRRFIKFCLVGLSSAIISFFILYVFTEYLHWWYMISAVLSFVISVIFNFIANKFWSFRNKLRGRAAYNQMVKYAVVYVSGMVINTFLIYAFTEFIGLDYRWSWFIATGIITFWNFGFTHFWTFGRETA